MRTFFCLISLLCCKFIFGQEVSKQLQEKISLLENDAQFKHAILSMYVVDNKTGKVVFGTNSEIGLAPASCQKVITSVSAFELLGKEYKYKTQIGYDGISEQKILNGNLYIIGNGDPTLGSWRWKETNAKNILKDFKDAVNKNFEIVKGNIFSYDRKWESNTTPKGWIWEDIGNYYGAGASAINWKENQFDIYFKAGDKIGASTELIKMEPRLKNVDLVNEVTTGAKGSGDNAIIYLPPYSPYGFVRGTIPLGEKMFKVSGAMPNAADQLAYEFSNEIKNANAEFLFIGSYNGIEVAKKDIPIKPTIIYTHYSPTVDSINYWFLKRSINLFGEALIKTIAYEKKGAGATDTGLWIIKYFWKQRGIEPSAINIIDGSGLSPANRVTTNALVTVLQYAKKQPWFPSFYNSLPDMNGIKMKDGYINGVRSYTGYIKSKSGNDYTFAFIVNNFDGSAASVREKMWKVLDVMK